STLRRRLPDLLHRADPVLDVVRRCELVASDGKHIEGHRLEAPAGRAGTEELAHRGSGRLPAHDDAIARVHAAMVSTAPEVTHGDAESLERDEATDRAVRGDVAR